MLTEYNLSVRSNRNLRLNLRQAITRITKTNHETFAQTRYTTQLIQVHSFDSIAFTSFLIHTNYLAFCRLPLKSEPTVQRDWEKSTSWPKNIRTTR